MTFILSGLSLFGGEVLKITWLSCGSDDPFGFAVGFRKTVKGNKWGNLAPGLVQDVGEFRMEHILILKYFNDQNLSSFAFRSVQVRQYGSLTAQREMSKACCLWEKQALSLPAKATTSFVQEETSRREINWVVRWLIWNCQSQAVRDCFDKCVLRLPLIDFSHSRRVYCSLRTRSATLSYLIVLPNPVLQVRSFFFYYYSTSIPRLRSSFP